MLDAAIVGLGWRGQVLVKSVHGRSGRIRFVRGVTRSPAKTEVFARETGIPVDSDFAAVLADADIPAVVLATPHSQHVEQIVAAAAAGKHIFVEKPLALWASDAQHAAVACRAAGVVLAVGQNRRFLSAFHELAARLRWGQIGDPLHVEGNYSGPGGYRHGQESWRASEMESPSGGMTAKGIHIADLMIALFGPVAEVDARSLRHVLTVDMDDTLAALLRFRSGMTGTLATMTTTADLWRLQVYGSKGWAEMRGQSTLAMRLIDGQETVTEFAPIDTERAELEAFADAVEGVAPFPVGIGEAVHNIALLEAIGKSSAQERPYPVPEIGPSA